MNIIRASLVCLLAAACAAAQSASAPNALAALEQNVQQKTGQWNKLAQNLELSIVKLLPCDPKATAAITEVNRASQARIDAIAAYLKEASRQAGLQLDAAKKVLESAQTVGADLAAEKSDLVSERSGIASQITNLTQSSQNRSSFTPALDELKQISTVEQQRSEALDAATSHTDPAAAALSDLVMQLEARQAAWKDIQAAFNSEGERWTAYYAARLARAQTECSITRGPAAAPRPQGKQK